LSWAIAAAKALFFRVPQPFFRKQQMTDTMPYTVQCPECGELFDITLDCVPQWLQSEGFARTFHDEYINHDDVVLCPKCRVQLHVEAVTAPDEKHISRYDVTRCRA
jgi:uncharacterized protein YbaR (Trm112 family)